MARVSRKTDRGLSREKPTDATHLPHLTTTKVEESKHTEATVLEQILQRQAHIEEEINDMRRERELYAPLSLTRHLAVISLMATLLNCLHHDFMKIVHESYDWMAWVGPKLPFPKETDISYFKSWWFWYHETLQQKSISLQQFWQNELGYTGTKASSDSKKARRIGTGKARLVAHTLSDVMAEAERGFISAVGNEEAMSCEMLRKGVGFYISVPRCDRNMGLHLIENLFSVQQVHGGAESSMKYQKPVKDPFKAVGCEFVVNEQLRDKGVMVLEDILANLDKLGELGCIRHVISWFGQWLLRQCLEEEDEEEEEDEKEEAINQAELVWEWNPKLRLQLCHNPKDGLFYDHEGYAWAKNDDKWIRWDQEREAWFSLGEGGWKREF